MFSRVNQLIGWVAEFAQTFTLGQNFVNLCVIFELKKEPFLIKKSK